MKRRGHVLPPAMRRQRLGAWLHPEADTWVLRRGGATVAQVVRLGGRYSPRLASGEPDTWQPWLEAADQLGAAQLTAERALAVTWLQQAHAVKAAAEEELRRRALALPPELARAARLRARALGAT